MNSGPAHMSERVLRSLGEHHIVVAFLTAQMSILQAADLVFLDAMKKLKTTLPREFVEGSMSELTRQLTQDCVQVVASMFKVHCDKERLRSDAGFNKLPA
jgi:hypothetical protein